MRSNLLRAISHDLRTPLTGMIGASSTYLEAKDQLDEDAKDQLVMGIKEDANWLLNMVENLLSITRIQSNGSDTQATCKESTGTSRRSCSRSNPALSEAISRQ